MTIVIFLYVFHKEKEEFNKFMYNNTTEILEMILDEAYNKKNPLASFRDVIPSDQLIVLKKNDIIIQQHEPLKDMYFLLSGYVSVLNHIDWTDDNIIDSLEPLDILGFIEYLNGGDRYTSYVVADTKCVLYRISIKTFAKIIQENARLCYKTLLAFSQITSHNMNRAEIKSLFHSRDVVGHYLYIQAEQAATLPFVCPLTRSTLADKLHINLRTLYRYIDSMKESNFLYLQKGKIVIGKEEFENLKKRYGNIVL